MYSPDISISVPASVRWKKNIHKFNDSKFSVANEKTLRSLVSTQDASKFLNTSFTPGLDTPKISRNDDFREVSLQLVHLKKKHDLNKNKNYLYQQLLDRDSKFVEKVQVIELKTLNLTDKLIQKSECLESKLEEVRKKQEEALAARGVYKHIFNRMKISQITFDEQNLSLNSNLKFSEQILSEEVNKSRKSKEHSKRTKSALSALNNYVSYQKKEKREKLINAEKDANQKISNSKNREFRMKRQIEIAESAADDDRNMRAMQMRESLMLHRVLFFLLEIKLKKTQQRFAVIDNSFHRIKNIYGVVEPSEMIEKILTKEQTYTDLLSSINYNKSRIVQQNERNSEMEEKIRQLNNLAMQNIDPNEF